MPSYLYTATLGPGQHALEPAMHKHHSSNPSEGIFPFFTSFSVQPHGSPHGCFERLLQAVWISRQGVLSLPARLGCPQVP